MAKRYSCGVEIAFSGGSISLGIDELEVAALREPWLRFPVVCPRCRREELSALPVAGVAAALLNGSAIPLHVSCHDIYWHASLTEIEQLREYLIIIGIGIERVAEANHPSMEARSMPLDKTGFAGRHRKPSALRHDLYRTVGHDGESDLRLLELAGRFLSARHVPKATGKPCSDAVAVLGQAGTLEARDRRTEGCCSSTQVDLGNPG